ncbi:MULTISPECIES: hypothetical protein [Rhizobium]|uniref:Uncharacterized protein n=1 Tax=Rhizobium rhododendri TaxID=2506430 RepID=A0ABY8IP92_9HYPH|nr:MULTISPECIES: hypothetical protein [Rhizobium]MBO9135079.1 hypothetical protein [Rhizobium sp. B209b/85]QXZ81007.1 hypothetical protein J5274_19040 [Rhizobium sp. L51/94]QXZ98008.1 hypothetical protein J5289_22120 [Rhizobium sp. B230/85]TQX85392.1 hypothetical protein EQW76_21905 [Rhizobium sp. rho-13.1]TQY09803.1 hypothetical protein EQW74_20890 [Rhizobium sp. rho-1.1]
MAMTKCGLRRNNGAAPRNRKRSSARILLSTVIVAAVAGAVLFPAPMLLDVLKKAAALTDVLLTKVMWSLWVGGSIASGDHSSFVSDKGIDERPLLRVSVEALSGRNQPLASSPVIISI